MFWHKQDNDRIKVKLLDSPKIKVTLEQPIKEPIPKHISPKHVSVKNTLIKPSLNSNKPLLPSFSSLFNINIPPKLMTFLLIGIVLILGSVGGIIAGVVSLSKKETTITLSNATTFSTSANIPSSLSLVAGDYKTYIANFTALTEEIRPFYFNLTINRTQGLTDNQLKIRIINGTDGIVINESSITSGNTISILRNVNIKNNDEMGFNVTIEANTTITNGSVYTLTAEIYPVGYMFR